MTNPYLTKNEIMDLPAEIVRQLSRDAKKLRFGQSRNYPYQFNEHVLTYLDDLISRTEAASVAHTLGTYY